jgi:hypothetical protein
MFQQIDQNLERFTSQMHLFTVAAHATLRGVDFNVSDPINAVIRHVYSELRLSPTRIPINFRFLSLLQLSSNEIDNSRNNESLDQSPETD